MLPPAPHGVLPGKAAVVMFERIAAVHQRLAAAAGSGGGGGGGQAGRVALVATAALTNVALLLALYPEVKDMIEVGQQSYGWGLAAMLCDGELLLLLCRWL